MKTAACCKPKTLSCLPACARRPPTCMSGRSRRCASSWRCRSQTRTSRPPPCRQAAAAASQSPAGTPLL
jgi:hypothetical protein